MLSSVLSTAAALIVVYVPGTLTNSTCDCAPLPRTLSFASASGALNSTVTVKMPLGPVTTGADATPPKPVTVAFASGPAAVRATPWTCRVMPPLRTGSVPVAALASIVVSAKRKAKPAARTMAPRVERCMWPPFGPL